MGTEAAILQDPLVPVDTACMIELAVAQMSRDSAWRTLLAAYDVAEPRPAHPDGPPEGWVARLREVEGVAAGDLSRIHGKLIAFGFLEFELSGRTEGVRYRLSRQGRAMLGAGRGTASVEDDEERDE